MNEIILGSVLFVAFVLILTAIVVAARALLLPRNDIMVSINKSTSLQAKAGTRLLDILNGAGIAVPAACGGKGTCGQCRVKVTDGAGKALATEAAKLTRQDIAAGMRLACQVTARANLEIEVGEDILGAESWACTVTGSRTLSPLIREIVIQLPDGVTFDFRAGAFIQVTAPPHLRRFSDFDIEPEHAHMWNRFNLRTMTSQCNVAVSRAYSIANRPQDSGCIVLLIRLALPPPTVHDAPPGIVSSYLFGLMAGDIIDVAGPYGEFSAQETGREMVFIGGGVGMAPLRAIIFDQLDTLQTGREMSFWYGARSRIDLFYQDEFDALQAKHSNFSWTPALSEPGEDWMGTTGFIHDVVLKQHLNKHPAPEDCEYYLCGPPLMIKAVLSMLDEIGVGPESIFFDDFGV